MDETYDDLITDEAIAAHLDRCPHTSAWCKKTAIMLGVLRGKLDDCETAMLAARREEGLMWETTDTAPKGEAVNTMISDKDGVRNQQKLKFDGKLWWYPDGSMYVYYTPTHWCRNT